MVVTSVLIVLFSDALRSKCKPLKVPIHVLQHPRGTKSIAHACSQWIDCTWVTLIAVRRRISIFGFSPLCLVDRFSQRPEILGSAWQSDSTRRPEEDWYANGVALALTGTYTDKNYVIFCKNTQNQHFFVNMHLQGRWKSLLALLATWKIHTV